MGLTKEERQAIDAKIPKCICGNNLSMDRVKDGIGICPSCEAPEETTDRDKGMTQGIGLAIGFLIGTHDYPTLAWEFCQETGTTLEEFEEHCDEYDLTYIRKMFEENK